VSRFILAISISLFLHASFITIISWRSAESSTATTQPQLTLQLITKKTTRDETHALSLKTIAGVSGPKRISVAVNSAKKIFAESASQTSSHTEKMNENAALHDGNDDIVNVASGIHEINHSSTALFPSPDIITKIRERLQAQAANFYSEQARRRHLEGTPVIEFMVGDHGEVTRAYLLNSSGSKILDDAAIRLIYAAAPYEAASLTLRVPIAFHLR